MWSTPIFIFAPGIRHSAPSRSISTHSALRSSPGRTNTKDAPSSLSYSLGGEYRELQALVGLDDGTGSAEGTVRLRLEGDGKLLANLEITGTSRAKPVKLSVNLKDVQVLKILVESPDLSPFGRHLIVANPKVSR